MLGISLVFFVFAAVKEDKPTTSTSPPHTMQSQPQVTMKVKIEATTIICSNSITDCRVVFYVRIIFFEDYRVHRNGAANSSQIADGFCRNSSSKRSPITYRPSGTVISIYY